MVEFARYSSEPETRPVSIPISSVSKARVRGYLEPPLPLEEPQTGTRYDDYIIVVTNMAKRLAVLGVMGKPISAAHSHTMEWFCREASMRYERPFPTGNRLIWREDVVTSAYRERLNELQECALEEQITPDPESLKDFNRFVDMADSPSTEGALFLLKDGTYRAMWRDDHWRLSLRFRGDSKIDYVLLDRTNPPNGETGTVDLNGFGKLRRGLDLESLLSE